MDIKLMPEKYKESRPAGGIGQSILGILQGRTNLWFRLTLSLLIIIVLICLGLWGYQLNLKKNKDALTQKLEESQAQRNPDLEAIFINLKRGIDDFEIISKNQISPLSLFKMLEELTLPQVQFNDLEVDFTNSRLGLDVEAVDYETLAEQIVVFKQDHRVKSIDFSNANLEDSGRVGSYLEIEFDPSFPASK
ncbi:MAG: hypothetical protein ABIF84_01930 [Patescibacteria group bacterium]